MKQHRQPGRLPLTAIAVAASQCLIASHALAQAPAAAAEATPIETIVVTTRRVAERLQEVPVSVSAYGAAQIEAAGIRGLEDVARLSPGFAFERTTGALAQPAIRGQAQVRVTNPVQNVASFFNGIYLQRSYQVDTDFLGVERVEVIKGPQSALFGRNAFAGAISVVSKKPDLARTTLRGELTLGTDELREVKALASIPFGNRFAISLALSKSESDGTWANNNPGAADLSGPGIRTKGNLNGYSKEGALLQVRVVPTENTEVNIFWNNRNIFGESPANYQMGAISGVTAFNTLNCKPFEASRQPVVGTNALWCGAIPTQPVLAPNEPRSAGLVADRRSYSQDSNTNVYGGSFEATLSDTLTFSATVGHTDADNNNLATLARDATRGLPANAGRVLLDSRGNGSIKSESLEARLTWEKGTSRLMGGVYKANVNDYEWGTTYFMNPNGTALPVNAAVPAGDILTFAGFPINGSFVASTRHENVYGAFLAGSMEVFKDFHVGLEGRQTREVIAQTALDYITGLPSAAVLNRTFNYFTPRLTLDYALAKDVMVYASAAKGVKSGGFNPGTAPEDLVYLPETNWTYELGLKSVNAAGNLMFNATVYKVDWSDMQVNRPRTNNASLSSPLAIGNVSGANVSGVEAQLRWRPAADLTLDAGASYTRAVFKDDAVDITIARALCSAATVNTAACPFTGNIGGNTVPRSPGVMSSAGATWKTGLGSLAGQGLKLVVRGDVSYQGKAYSDATNTAWVSPRTLMNGSVALESKSWTLRFWGRNLADKEYVSYSFVTMGAGGRGSGANYAPLLGDRRTLGVTLSANY